ncbi:hypothetical protein SAMN05192554_14411 [Haloarchaeobius iranensis]|uniref:Uncharacterized protein n=2 Tax=Haloarchaeobius iranensis TaxID=996166 RepID=A0A1H0BN54_9EURY|nr:hypothetical protein SAMN05192554_14411 [Haloarchaeobius iranensis]
MHFLAIATYLACGFLGTGFLLLEGIPEIGIADSTLFTPGSPTLVDVVGDPITVISVAVLAAQLYVLWDITVAWVAYKRNTKVLERTIKQQVVSGNFTQGLQSIDPLFDDD